MKNMKYIIITYAVILTLGIAALFTGFHYLANIAGFIASIGFLVVYFKDRDEEDDFSEDELAEAKKFRRYWYVVFATGLFFSFVLGSFWNHEMGNMPD